MQHGSRFALLNEFEAMTEGEVRLVLGPRSDHVSGLLRSMVLSSAVNDWTSYSLVSIGQAAVDAHPDLIVARVGTHDAQHVSEFQRSRIREVVSARLSDIQPPSIDAQTLARRLDPLRPPVVVIDGHGGAAPASRRDTSRFLRSLRA